MRVAAGLRLHHLEASDTVREWQVRKENVAQRTIQFGGMDPAGSLTNYTQKVRPNYKDIPGGTHLNRSRTRLPYIGKEVIAGLESTRKGVNGGDVGYW